jgi:hypothetical protein
MGLPGAMYAATSFGERYPGIGSKVSESEVGVMLSLSLRPGGEGDGLRRRPLRRWAHYCKENCSEQPPHG